MIKYTGVYKDSELIADKIEIADSFFSRLKGLTGQKNLPDGHGLYLPRCGSVHTFGMMIPIDVVFLSEDGTVVDIEREMKPKRIRFANKSTANTLEIPAKSAININIGDVLVFKKTERNKYYG